jgi:hypothetical protein
LNHASKHHQQQQLQLLRSLMQQELAIRNNWNLSLLQPYGQQATRLFGLGAMLPIVHTISPSPVATLNSDLQSQLLLFMQTHHDEIPPKMPTFSWPLKSKAS